MSQIERTVKPRISSHSKSEVSYETSQMFCFEYTVFWNKTFEMLLWDRVRGFEWLWILGLGIAFLPLLYWPAQVNRKIETAYCQNSLTRNMHLQWTFFSLSKHIYCGTNLQKLYLIQWISTSSPLFAKIYQGLDPKRHAHDQFWRFLVVYF